MNTDQNTMHEETEIISRIVSGETHLFAVLTERYGDRVFALISRFVTDAADVEDIAQDTFVQAFSQLRTFRGESSFASWLYRIAYNMVMQRLRRRHLQMLSIDDGAPDNIADRDVDDYFASTSDERIDMVLDALEQLPPVEHTIIELYYFEDLSIKEIAAILSLTETAISTKLYRSRKHIYKLVKQKETYDNRRI